jgi:rod shape determining protein RodA
MALSTLMVGYLYVAIALLILAGLLFFFIKRNRRNIINLVALLMLGIGFVFSVNYAVDNFLGAHQKTRINVLLGKELDLRGAGYNVNQSKIAIGSGGFSGKGFLNGTQTKYNFVPEQSTDFIFCTVGEEWGFLGSMVVIVLFILLLTRIVIVAERQRSDFSRIYGYGVAAILFFHFVINIGMTIGLVPVIGIPLPFFSYGGSSLWSFTILLFIFIKQDVRRNALL